MYESDFITGMLDARVAEWIVLTSPAMAEFIVDMLGQAADDMEDHGAFERYAGTALTAAASWPTTVTGSATAGPPLSPWPAGSTRPSRAARTPTSGSALGRRARACDWSQPP
ncbi:MULTISPECIES: hypothetical protein [Streptosporangium]|uniref:Uncharacterized protein n=1 Tax=Streptosporangium brasiliense TaxID=47480 RepID=A0ABT9RG59_9ACTN|nr:hypothetical protein [Streptosporangium brasiliense]MDP9868247.1 hypothetical protein [Streptosporangium brasiliense]